MPRPYRRDPGKSRPGRASAPGLAARESRDGQERKETLMNWLDFYLICFAVGGGFSLMALMGGTFHAPHVHLHHGSGAAGGAFNMGTISAFLLWFGAGGYVITRFETWWFLWALLIAGALGLTGASMVFWFIA